MMPEQRGASGLRDSRVTETATSLGLIPLRGCAAMVRNPHQRDFYEWKQEGRGEYFEFLKTVREAYMLDWYSFEAPLPLCVITTDRITEAIVPLMPVWNGSLEIAAVILGASGDERLRLFEFVVAYSCGSKERSRILHAWATEHWLQFPSKDEGILSGQIDVQEQGAAEHSINAQVTGARPQKPRAFSPGILSNRLEIYQRSPAAVSEAARRLTKRPPKAGSLLLLVCPLMQSAEWRELLTFLHRKKLHLQRLAVVADGWESLRERMRLVIYTWRHRLLM